MERTLKTGESVPELNEAKTLTVYTRCPEKWKLIDMETGEEYVGYSSDGKNSWRKLNDI
jgi:hypothetical protein